jgi:hypothetical protein
MTSNESINKINKLYTYLTYPNEIEGCLKINRDSFSRTIYRYALEKMNNDKKKEFMGL